MKYAGALMAVLWLVQLRSVQAEVNQAAIAQDGLPNIVILYADDMGYGDPSCYNPERGKIHTVHIDRLASQGMRFTDAHSSSAVCSPSRYTLLTGRYHWRTRLQRGIVGLWERPLIAEDRLTLAGLLKQHGYQTACVGKWHLGWNWPIEPQLKPLFKRAAHHARATEAHRQAWRTVFSKPIAGGPITRGFDEYFGTDVPNWPPYCFIENDRTVGIPTEYLPARLFTHHLASVQGPALKNWSLEAILPTLAERASAYIHRAARQGKPFFIYVPLTAPHTPLAVTEPFRGKSGLGTYGDFVLETDAIVGQILQAIDHTGQTDRTVVIFTSDNGCAPYIGVAELEKRGHYPSGPLRGYKSDVWDGGHRVPFIVRWPGVVRAGTVCRQLVHQADLMRTFAAIVGATLPDNAAEDSVNLLPLFQGNDHPVRQTAVSQSARGLLSIRRGSWKLIFGQGSGGWTAGSDDQPEQLYNLADDVGEMNNLFSARPDIVAQLTSMMQQQIENGRSTPGAKQDNDQPVTWKPVKPSAPSP